MTCAFGYCERRRRVSGDSRVWACRFPALAATASRACFVGCWFKLLIGLSDDGVLCCIPIEKE